MTSSRDSVCGSTGNEIPILYPRKSKFKKYILPAARLYARTVPPGESKFSTNTDRAVRFIIQTLGGIGNTLMATPLFAEMRRLFPAADIDVLTTQGGAAILAGNPHVSRVLVDPASAGAPRTSIFDVRASPEIKNILQLNRGSYDACFMALNSIDLRGGLRPLLARIPVRVIHRYPFEPHDDFTGLFTHRVDYERKKHDCVGNLDLLRAVVDAEVRDVRMVLNVKTEWQERALLALAGQGWAPAPLTIGVCPGCRDWARDKRWPIENFAKLISNLLSHNADARVLAFCGPHDLAEAEYLTLHVDNARFHLVKEMGLDVYGCALKACDVVVTNDSLPMHMCSALNVPVVALFGPTDPARVGPWMVPSRVLQSGLAYTPYFEMPYFRDLGVGDTCMAAISVEDVFMKCLDLMGETSNRCANPLGQDQYNDSL